MSLGMDEIEGILSAHGQMPTGASFKDGETFGNWRVTAFLGKGGNGEVYRAVHVSLGTAAALKVLVRNEPRARERFVREARLLSDLKSASFPQFFEYGEANGFFYLVMELLIKRHDELQILRLKFQFHDIRQVPLPSPPETQARPLCQNALYLFLRKAVCQFLQFHAPSLKISNI